MKKRSITVQEAGRLGALATNAALSPQQRSESARRAALAAAAKQAPEDRAARGRKAWQTRVKLGKLNRKRVQP